MQAKNLVTNDDKPFSEGEEILFAGDRYKVVENHGDSGTVRCLDDGFTLVNNFRWTFEGEKCVRAKL